MKLPVEYLVVMREQVPHVYGPFKNRYDLTQTVIAQARLHQFIEQAMFTLTITPKPVIRKLSEAMQFGVRNLIEGTTAAVLTYPGNRCYAAGNTKRFGILTGAMRGVRKGNNPNFGSAVIQLLAPNVRVGVRWQSGRVTWPEVNGLVMVKETGALKIIG